MSVKVKKTSCKMEKMLKFIQYLFSYFIIYHNILIIYLLSNTQSRLLTTLREQPFENIMGKGGNAGNQYFLLFQ